MNSHTLPAALLAEVAPSWTLMLWSSMTVTTVCPGT